MPHFSKWLQMTSNFVRLVFKKSVRYIYIYLYFVLNYVWFYRLLAYITLLYVLLIIIVDHRLIPAGPVCSADRFFYQVLIKILLLLIISIACLFSVFMTLNLKLCFKIFRKRSHRICSNFGTIEATKGGTSCLKRFLKKTPGLQKYKGK